MHHTWKRARSLEKYTTLENMRYTLKNAAPLEKMRHAWKNTKHFEKYATLGKVRYTRKKAHLEKCSTL